MSRSERKEYPYFVNYMLRFDAGSLQNNLKIPASLVARLREGEVPAGNLSNSSIQKFYQGYQAYWDNRLKASGFNESERKHIRTTFPPDVMREKIARNRETAGRIMEERRLRDKNLKGFRNNWHTKKDILRQMSLDFKRDSDEWYEYITPIREG